MNILIVGGCGYVGGYLTDYLMANGYSVTVYDSLIYESRYLKNVPFIYGDVRDRRKLSSIINNFDVVVWLAAIVGDGACAVDPFLTQSINEDSVKWLSNNYYGKMVFPSSCSIYGVNNELIDESAVPNPLSVYARTKLAAEQYIITNRDNYLIFRLGTLYGISDEHSRLRLDLVVNALTKKAVIGEKLIISGGEQWRPLLHVRDVSIAIYHGVRNNICGLFNLNSGNYRIREIADEIKRVIPSLSVEHVNKKFEDLRNYRVSSDRYINTGWEPKFTLNNGITQIMEVIGNHRLKNMDDPIYSNEKVMELFYPGFNKQKV